ncbi:MAG: M48 family peptidase, partial [Caldimonas sp.]
MHDDSTPTPATGCALCASLQRRGFVRLLAGAAASAVVPAARAREGVEVGPPSTLSKLVPAEQIERAAAGQYAAMLRDAQGKRALANERQPQLQRLRTIAERIVPFTPAWNERARSWPWEVNLIASKQVNAFCMPGGKIAF